MNYEMLREILAARRKSFFFLLFLLALNLAVMLYLSMWQRPQLAKAQNEWFAKREAAKSGQSAGAAAIYENGLRDLALLQKRIVPKKEFPSLIEHLYESAKSDSVELAGITYKPGAVKEVPGMISYGVSFTASGKYAAVKSLVADLARYKEMVTLDSLSLSSKSNIEETVVVRVQMTAYLKMEGA